MRSSHKQVPVGKMQANSRAYTKTWNAGLPYIPIRCHPDLHPASAHHHVHDSAILSDSGDRGLYRTIWTEIWTEIVFLWTESDFGNDCVYASGASESENANETAICALCQRLEHWLA